MIILLAGAIFVFFNMKPAHQGASINSVEPTQAEPTQVNKQLREASSDKKANLVEVEAMSTNSLIETRQAIQECTQRDATSLNSFQDLKKIFEINKPQTSNIIRNNLIFQKNNNEHRVSLYPSEDGSSWHVDEFTVDAEGLPIPGKKEETKDYLKSVQQVKNKITDISQLIDEMEFSFSIPQHNGTALLVNGQILRLVLFNTESQRSLDCRNLQCKCY